MTEFESIRFRTEEETTSNSSVYRKHRRRLLGCSLCPPNRRENANRVPRTDIHKDIRKGKHKRRRGS